MHMAVKEWEGGVFHMSHLESVFRIQKKNIDPVVVVICSKLGQDLQRVAREVPARALPKQAVRHGKRIVDNDDLSNKLSERIDICAFWAGIATVSRFSSEWRRTFMVAASRRTRIRRLDISPAAFRPGAD